MKNLHFSFFQVILFCSLPALSLQAVEAGFVPLLDREHTDGWKQTGNGGMKIKDGVATTWVAPPGKMPGSGNSWHTGINWYMKQGFGDFDLRLEFKADEPTSNSGVFLRSPSIDAEVKSFYEVQIYGRAGQDQPTGSFWGLQPSSGGKLKLLGEWNELEIIAKGQYYTVRLNGQVVNQFVGNRETAGLIGLQSHPKGPVQFRNIRVKDLSAATPSIPLATIQTDSSLPRIQVIKDQGPNATEWALTPLDEAIPADIRQNLTSLREDLLDEGAKAAKGNPKAYQLASDYCDKILAALSQRELARVNAGYRTAQAEANKAIGNQALDARRNYKMSWPQYAREESQRSSLRENESDKADVKKEQLKVEWAGRAEQMRKALDDLYARFREAVRQSPAAK